MNFVEKVNSTHPAQGTVELFWLGQAGFLIKTASGKIIAIDPYLSDYVYRTTPEDGFAFKRLNPPVMAPGDIVFDCLIISHEHGDHYDADSIDAFTDNDVTSVLTNRPVAEAIKQRGFERVITMEKGVKIDFDEFSILPVDCDHGDLAPEALGFIIDFGFAKIYYAGDTSLTPARLTVPIETKLDVAILPINGAFGNLDSVQAAQYAGMLDVKTVVPCHFWTFPRHLGNPQEIIEAMPKYAPQTKLILLCQGEGMTVM